MFILQVYLMYQNEMIEEGEGEGERKLKKERGEFKYQRGVSAGVL
jgi:hypothetical protein